MTADDERLAQQAANDARLAAVQRGIKLDFDLRENIYVMALHEAFQKDASAAAREFAMAPLGDMATVMSLQARCYRALRAVDIVASIRQAAALAEAELLAQDKQAEGYERNDD